MLNTSDRNSPLARRAGCHVGWLIWGTSFRSESLVSRIVQLALIGSLYTSVMLLIHANPRITIEHFSDWADKIVFIRLAVQRISVLARVIHKVLLNIFTCVYRFLIAVPNSKHPITKFNESNLVQGESWINSSSLLKICPPQMWCVVDANDYKDYLLGLIFYNTRKTKRNSSISNQLPGIWIREFSYWRRWKPVDYLQQNIGLFHSFSLFSTWIKMENEFSG